MEYGTQESNFKSIIQLHELSKNIQWMMILTCQNLWKQK